MYSQRANAEALLAVASASFVVSVTTSGPLRAVALATAAVIAATAAAPSRGDIATASFLILLIDICCWRIDFCKISHSFSPTRASDRPCSRSERRSPPRRATCQPPTDRSAGLLQAPMAGSPTVAKAVMRARLALWRLIHAPHIEVIRGYDFASQSGKCPSWARK